MSNNNATMQISLTSYKKLNPDSEFIAIKSYPVSKEINSINNSAQRLSNNVKLNENKLGSKKNIVSTLSNFSAFLNSHLYHVFITAKNAENVLQQANLQITNLYSVPCDVIGEKEPTYHVPNDGIAKQGLVDNAAHYSVIASELNNDEVYYAQKYATLGAKAHTYDQIDDATLEEKEEHIYEEMENYARKEKKAPLNSEQEMDLTNLNSAKEIDLTKLNSLSSFEKPIFNAMRVNEKSVLEDAPAEELKNKRNEITRLAEQTFPVEKSFISRVASSIWNALFGAKNRSEVVPPADLVARAMHTNIDGICQALNKQINNSEVDGLFRKEPGKATYDKNSPKQLVEVFNSDKCYSDPIGLAWMIKHYIARNLPKITIDEFNNNKNQTKFNELLDNKINQIESDMTRENIKSCFATIKNSLMIAENLTLAKELLEKKLNSAKESNLSKQFDLANELKLNKELLAKELKLDEKLLDNGLEVVECGDDKKITVNSTLTKDSIIGSMLTAFIAKSEDPVAELSFMKDKQREFSNIMAQYVANNY